MKKILQSLAFAITTYGFWSSCGWGVGPDIILWNMYAQSVITAPKNITAYNEPITPQESTITTYNQPETNPLLIEEKRETPAQPPPARLFVSAEGRYAIQQGWLTGADYAENKTATHGDAVAMVLQITSLDLETAMFYGFDAAGFNEDPEKPLTQQDFINYLGFIFYDLPDEGIFESHNDATPEREITLIEMARAAYRLRGSEPFRYNSD